MSKIHTRSRLTAPTWPTTAPKKSVFPDAHRHHQAVVTLRVLPHVQTVAERHVSSLQTPRYAHHMHPRCGKQTSIMLPWTVATGQFKHMPCTKGSNGWETLVGQALRLPGQLSHPEPRARAHPELPTGSSGYSAPKITTLSLG